MSFELEWEEDFCDCCLRHAMVIWVAEIQRSLCVVCYLNDRQEETFGV